MQKIRISVQYKYLNDELGTFPYVHIGYVNDLCEELTASDIIQKKISSSKVPNTGYFYGTTLEGEEFKVGKIKNVPSNANKPICYKKPEYDNIEEFSGNNIEMIIKKRIIDIIEQLGNDFDISYCSYDSNSKIIFDKENVLDFIKKDSNKFLIDGIHLKDSVEVQYNYSIEAKLGVMAMLIVKLYESLIVQKLGFSIDKNSIDGLVEFDLFGLSLDLISKFPNYETVVCNTLLNQTGLIAQDDTEDVEKSNKKVKVKIKKRANK